MSIIWHYLETCFPKDIDAVMAPHLVNRMMRYSANIFQNFQSFHPYFIYKIIKPLQQRDLIKTLIHPIDNKRPVVDIINSNINKNKNLEDNIKRKIQDNAIYLRDNTTLTNELFQSISFAFALEKIYGTIIDAYTGIHTFETIGLYIQNSPLSQDYIEQDLIAPSQQKYQGKDFQEKLKFIIKRLVKKQEIINRLLITAELRMKQVETWLKDDAERLQNTPSNEDAYQKIKKRLENDTIILKEWNDNFLHYQLREARWESLNEFIINKFFEIQENAKTAQEVTPKRQLNVTYLDPINTETHQDAPVDKSTSNPQKRKSEDELEDGKVTKKPHADKPLKDTQKRKLENSNDSKPNKKTRVNEPAKSSLHKKLEDDAKDSEKDKEIKKTPRTKRTPSNPVKKA